MSRLGLFWGPQSVYCGKRQIRIAVDLALIALTAAACQRYTVHLWHGDASFDREAVQFLAPAKLSRPREEPDDDATRRFKEDPFVRLWPESFASLSK